MHIINIKYYYIYYYILYNTNIILQNFHYTKSKRFYGYFTDINIKYNYTIYRIKIT